MSLRKLQSQLCVRTGGNDPQLFPPRAGLSKRRVQDSLSHAVQTDPGFTSSDGQENIAPDATDDVQSVWVGYLVRGKGSECVQWDRDDDAEVIAYRKGDWEETIMAQGNVMKGVNQRRSDVMQR